jgi:hypothetical protein
MSLLRKLKNVALLDDDGKLTVLELKQRRFLRPRILQLNLRWREVNLPALPTNGLLLPDVPTAEVALADETKVPDGRRSPLNLSNCLKDFQLI